jgi:hypothetical protein
VCVWWCVWRVVCVWWCVWRGVCVWWCVWGVQVDEVVHESPTAFLHKLDNEEEDFSKPMKFVSDRLRSLLRTLEVTDVQVRRDGST